MEGAPRPGDERRPGARRAAGRRRGRGVAPIDARDARGALGALGALAERLPPLVFVVGKGGVGKTTCAGALAVRLAASRPTLLLSTDPAGTLGDALGTALGASPAPVPGAPGLDAAQLDAAAYRAHFLDRWRDALVTIVDRGTYLDRADIEPLIDASLPGADEVFALLRLGELLRASAHASVVVDTAPTGHTLRLPDLPRLFDALLALLDAMQEKHRFMVRALTRRYRADAADAFLAELRAETGALRDALRDRARTAAVVVTRDEPVVAAETARLVDALGARGIGVAACVVNAAERAPAVHGCDYAVPRLAAPPVGIEGLRAWGGAVMNGLTANGLTANGLTANGLTANIPPSSTSPFSRSPFSRSPFSRSPFSRPPSGRSRSSTSPSTHPLLRPLTVVAGKGGVGKTTVACALALAAAVDGPTLLVSTDPAPSVGDALALEVPDADTPVPGAPGLVARQMDAGAAFAAIAARYQERIDGVFAGLMARGLDAAHDRAIVRELLALAPPGIDELYALAELGSTLAEGTYVRVIVDPAPTGHLLRLLEMPELALGWSHQLMRLMLRYREIGGLAEAGEEVLAFAKRTRALGALLRDPARAGVVVVALDEPLVRGESARLIGAVRAKGIDVVGVVWNRAGGDVAPAPLDDTPPLAVVAPARDTGPVGVDALRRWAAEWTIDSAARD